MFQSKKDKNKWRRCSPMRVWASMLVTAAVCSCCWFWGWYCGWWCGWYKGWYCGLYCGWGWGGGWLWSCSLASPWERVEEAEEEVEEPWTVRLIQASGLCRFGLTWGGGMTTDECLGTDVSSSEPEEESKQKKAKGEWSASDSSTFSQCLFLSYLVVYAFRWGTAHRWSGAWLAWEVPSSPLYV